MDAVKKLKEDTKEIKDIAEAIRKESLQIQFILGRIDAKLDSIKRNINEDNK